MWNTHYFLKPPLDKWPDELGKNVGTLLWGFCNYQQKPVTFPPCWWNPLLSYTAQKLAALLLCSIRSWHRLMSNISPRWMMRLGKNTAATWIFCIGLQSFFGFNISCYSGRAAVPSSSSHGVTRGRDMDQLSLLRNVCYRTVFMLRAPSSAGAGEWLQTFLSPTAAIKWTDRGFPATSDSAQTLPFWHIPSVGGKAHAYNRHVMKHRDCPTSFTGFVCQANI